MPTYEYRCTNGHTFDVFQKMSEEPVATCPDCGEAAERVISGGAGFLFKGEGFYITDYRSKEYRERAEAEKPGAGAASEKGSGPDGGAAGGEKEGKGGGSTSGGDGGSGGGTSTSSGSPSGNG